MMDHPAAGNNYHPRGAKKGVSYPPRGWISGVPSYSTIYESGNVPFILAEIGNNFSSNFYEKAARI